MTSTLRSYEFALVCDAGGDFTATKSVRPVRGFLYAVELILGTLASGAADVTLSTVNPTRTILTLTNVAADAVHMPRVQGVGNTGSVIAGVYDKPVIDGNLKVVVAQGGNAGAGKLRVWVEENS